MAGVATYSSSLNSLLAGMLARMPGAAHAVLATVDGVTVAVSAGLPQERAEQLATIGSGLLSIADGDIFPIPPNGAAAGWVYLNLDSLDADATYAEQAWVISSMRAEGRYSGDFDATAFGNGCSPRAGESEISEDGTGVIGPSPNTTP